MECKSATVFVVALCSAFRLNCASHLIDTLISTAPECADVPEVQFYTAAGESTAAQGLSAAGTHRASWGTSTGKAASSGRVFGGGKLPVVSSQAMAMATVNRQLMVSAAPGQGAAPLPMLAGVIWPCTCAAACCGC